MRSIFLLFLGILLYNFCHCSPLDNGNQYFKKTTKLTDLDEDCLYLIFNRLDLNNLLNVAQINFDFQRICSDIVRQSYADYELRIQKSKPIQKRPFDTKTSIAIIALSDFKLASNMIKYFGNYFRKVNILNRRNYNYTSGSDWAMINRIVNEYGSKSLTELGIGTISKELWSQFAVPFESVEKLEIKIDANTDGMKLNKLFPNVRELHLHLMFEANYDLIDCQLPHLEHLHLNAGVGHIWNRKEEIIEFIKKNPQIRDVNAMHAQFEFIKVVDELLPSLENISLQFDDNHEGRLHFETVKHCALQTLADSSLTNLSFSQLQSLETSFTPGNLETFIEFFQRHSNLSRLHLRRDNEQVLPLEELTAELPNLVEVIVEYYTGVRIENVIEFIETHPMVIKFQFPANEIKETDEKVLYEIFEEDWHIKRLDDGDFLLEKKNGIVNYHENVQL